MHGVGYALAKLGAIPNVYNYIDVAHHGWLGWDNNFRPAAQLIANTASYADPAKKKAIDQLTILLNGAISARGKVLLKLNIDRARLPAVVQALPAMRAPTVSELAEPDYFAVETIVSKATVNTLIPTLKDLGAEDIVELPVAKIVP